MSWLVAHKDVVEIAKNLFEIFAIILGALWTYLGLFKGRTYKAKLECDVGASIGGHSGLHVLKAVARVKNVGLSKVRLEQKGTGLSVRSARRLRSSPEFPTSVEWSDQKYTFGVFTSHEWIESGETVSDPIYVALPHDLPPAYKLTLTVVSGKAWSSAETIVEGSD
jgi:hypothetical protein